MTMLSPTAREADGLRLECPTCAAPAGTWCVVRALPDRPSTNYMHVKRIPKREGSEMADDGEVRLQLGDVVDVIRRDVTVIAVGRGTPTYVKDADGIVYSYPNAGKAEFINVRREA